MAKYVVVLVTGESTPAVLTAGSQGLAIVDCELTSYTTSVPVGAAVHLASSTSGGDAAAILPLEDGVPAALSTARTDISQSFTSLGLLGRWDFGSPISQPVHILNHPVYLAPGSMIVFEGANNASLNIYFEE